MEDSAEVDGDEIADAVLKNFGSWEKKRKPLVRTNGVREWVPLSGIVAQGDSWVLFVQNLMLMICREAWLNMLKFCVSKVFVLAL